MADDDLSTKEAFDQTAQAAFRGIAAIAKVHPAIAHNEPAKAFLTTFLPVVGLSVSRMAQRFFADRLPRLSKGYAHAFESDPKKVEEHAAKHEDDPDYHEVMFRTFCAMAEAADPEVVPALDYLAGQYTYLPKKPDGYFRALGRILCELDRRELDQLVSILRGVATWSRDSSEVADITCGPDDSVSIYKPSTSNVPLGRFPSGLRLIHVLKRKALVTDMPTPLNYGTDKISAGDRGMRIRFEMCDRILSTIDPRADYCSPVAR